LQIADCRLQIADCRLQIADYELRRLRIAMRVIMAAVVALGVSVAPVRADQGLGRISFPTSGSAAAQPAFIRGVLLLHSFEFDDAAEAFREARRIDPGFAMAYWGEALTFTHPLWREQNRDAAL
jgi:hypothetical protein